MSIALFGELLGGVGLFLLGMQLLTDGLKQAAGSSLRTVLKHATGSRWRGLLSGTLITAAVQSSSAVTVATLGFVNAGLMSLRQSMTVIYGCNIGTTITGWLVALIGLKLSISAIALPLIALGIVLNRVRPQHRLGHYGLALCGFGLFFIGLDFVRNAFSGMADSLPLNAFGSGPVALTLFVLLGVLMTTLTQASAAVMAIALSLVHTGAIHLSGAAALVIGANVGTTTTALLAAIGSTPNAKRIAATHVIFNIQTALVGILLLIASAGLLDSLDPASLDLVILLALFHTLFNLAGVAMIWPLTPLMETLLSRLFLTQEERLASPRHLDRNILSMPDLAIEAINKELARVSRHVTAQARAALSSEVQASRELQSQTEAIYQLVGEIIRFNRALAQQKLSAELIETLPVSLRVARYLNEIARIAAELPRFQPTLDALQSESTQRRILDFKQQLVALLDACEIIEHTDIQGIDAHRSMRELKTLYQELKLALLNDTVEGRLANEESLELLDYLTELKRLANQAENVSSHWSSTLPVQIRSQLMEPRPS